MTPIKITIPDNTIVEVVGNVGTGKTTLSKKLAKKTNAKYMDIDPYMENPFLSLSAGKRKRWAFITSLHFSFERSGLIGKVVKTLPSPMILDHGFDSGLFMYPWSSYILGEMTKDEWVFFQKLHSRLTANVPEIKVSIFLRLDSKSIMKRLKERGRPHEASYSQKYIEQLQKGLDLYKKKLIQEGSRESIIEYNVSNNTLTVHGKRNKILESLLC